MLQHCYPTCFMSQQGYRNRRSYIATQGPLAETTDDFWRLLWENNSTIVVMLTKLREMGRVRINAFHLRVSVCVLVSVHVCVRLCCLWLRICVLCRLCGLSNYMLLFKNPWRYINYFVDLLLIFMFH